MLVVMPLAASAGDWPQFLGPNRDGTVAETNLNLDWKAKPPKVVWKVPAGESFSSVAVVGDRLYTMSRHGQRDHIDCLDAVTGMEKWTVDAAPTYLDTQKHGYGPRATPTVHEDEVYCLFPGGELLCVTTAGKPVWNINIFSSTGAANPHGEYYYWGLSLSPLIEGESVIVQPGGNKDNSVAAFDRKTGKLLWKCGSDPAGYGSPIAITIGKQRQIIVPTGQSVLGIDPQAGKVLWRYAFGNKFNATCTTPVWAEGLLFVSAAYGAGCAALEIIEKDSTWSVREKWRKKDLQNLFATSIVHDGHVYGCHGDLGAIFLKCFDFKTGALKWDERQRNGRVTLLRAGNRLLVQSEKGALQVVEASPKGYSLRCELPDVLAFKAWSTPAIANGRMYVRDQKSIVCVDLR
jgi:outer membrane protein assembly factor BamB